MLTMMENHDALVEPIALRGGGSSVPAAEAAPILIQPCQSCRSLQHRLPKPKRRSPERQRSLGQWSVPIFLLFLIANDLGVCQAFMKILPRQNGVARRQLTQVHHTRQYSPLLAMRDTVTTSTASVAAMPATVDTGVSTASDDLDFRRSQLRAQAAQLRLEAELMEEALTRSKLGQLQTKLSKLERKQELSAMLPTMPTNMAPRSSRPESAQAETTQQLAATMETLKGQIVVLQQRLLERQEQQTNENNSIALDNVGNTILVAATAVAQSPTQHVNSWSSSAGSTDSSSSIATDASTVPSLLLVGTETTTVETTSVVATTAPILEPAQPAISSVAAQPEPLRIGSGFDSQEETEMVAGFDKVDLDLYLPVAIRLQNEMPSNSTADERLEAFRAAPELQEHFSSKLTKLILGPMQDMQRLEELKESYLSSTSSKEKEQLKRDIDSLTKRLEKDGPFSYSDSIYYPTPPLTNEALQAQMAAVSNLPDILQTLYKKRHDLDSDASLELAVLLEHYESQVQLLEQVQLVAPESPALPGNVRDEILQALESLPVLVRDHVAECMDLDPTSYTFDELIAALCRSDDDDADGVTFDWNPLKQVAIAAAATPMDSADEYDDISFVDRSRYLQEFYPAVARMEGHHPPIEAVDAFTKWLARDKRTFMANSKAERVVGGYYIRGQNLVDTDYIDSGTKLVERIRMRLQAGGTQREPSEIDILLRQLEFYYIMDPSPLTDEEVEMELRPSPVILVTGKNATAFYKYASPTTKLAVSALGLGSMIAFSLGVCALEPSTREQMLASWTLLTAGESVNVDWLVEIVAPLVLSLLTIQSSHEAGHRFVSWRDKFDVGLPTLLPSIQLGSFGAITPITSPPPSISSIFDFGMAGPLAGVIVSLSLFAFGLSLTAVANFNDVAALFPALPTDLLRSSALGGGLIELFLGKSALVSNSATAIASGYSVVPLHPIAIAGFVGLLSNALALLPIGNTDGGRVSLAMFRRRGAYVVQVFTTSLLCIAGLVGLDNMGLLLIYTLFTVACQAELETPARNEVDELDFGRGAFGIAMAVVVALALLPI